MLRIAPTDDKIRKIVSKPSIVPTIIGPTFMVSLTMMPKKRTIIIESTAAIETTRTSLSHCASVVGVQKFLVSVNSLNEEIIKQQRRIAMRNSVINVFTLLLQVVMKRPHIIKKTPSR